MFISDQRMPLNIDHIVAMAETWLSNQDNQLPVTKLHSIWIQTDPRSSRGVGGIGIVFLFRTSLPWGQDYKEKHKLDSKKIWNSPC